MDHLPAEQAKPTPVPSHVQGKLIAQTSFAASSYAGPIPPPEALERYEAAVPGLALKIVEWADRQANHRQSLERTVIEGDSSRAWWGLAAGLLIAMTFGIGGMVLIYLGHDAAGATVATGTVVGLTGVFIYGTNSRRAEREGKSEEVKGKRKK